MKTYTTYLSIIAAALFTSNVQAATSGQVTFTGEVFNQTCQVDDKTANKAVTLNPVRASALDSAGKTSTPTNFALALRGCTKGATVGLKFDKTNVDPSTGTLNNTGTAQKVNIQIVNGSGTAMNLNTQDKSDYVTPSADDNLVTYNYKAQYFATGEATAGSVNTFAVFNIDYQ